MSQLRCLTSRPLDCRLAIAALCRGIVECHLDSSDSEVATQLAGLARFKTIYTNYQKFRDMGLNKNMTGLLQKLVWVTPLMLALGCSDGGPELTTVTGTITLDGKPMPGVLVTFAPAAGSPSYGKTDAEGKYDLWYTDDKKGAMLGKHDVMLEVDKLSASEIAEMKAEGQTVDTTPTMPIPRKYRGPNALSAEVAEGTNQIDFELTSK